jgi:hypothetical protein
VNRIIRTSGFPRSFDGRSFELNDEVNLALFDNGVAARPAKISSETCRNPFKSGSKNGVATERLFATVGIVLEHQV